MITDSVIKEIYRKFKKPPKNEEELNLDYFLDLLKPDHNIRLEDDSPIKEVIIEDLDEFNPFRRFLVRNLRAILEFDKNVAFVFPTHILFLGKGSDACNVHLKPDDKGSFFSRIFGR